MLYIDPAVCIDCSACVEVCPVNAIVPDWELQGPEVRFAAINAAFFVDRPAAPPREDKPGPDVTARVQQGPLRVAIVGSGPAGFYAAAEILANVAGAQVEMFDRLPTPWGLVRAGVAPDHPGTKQVARQFQWTAARPGFHFHLNVEVGSHVTHEELLAHHHAVIYAVGAASDRRLGIAGEDLRGSHAATHFVGWYNGHPDYADREFDLSSQRAVIIGNGNVALDVARMLVSSPDRLAATDIADHALAAFGNSNIEEVVVLGRRGPEQAAFTTPELLALGELTDVDLVIDPREASIGALDETHPRAGAAAFAARLKADVVTEFAARPLRGHRKRIVLRFGVSPLEILGTERVEGLRIVHNEIVVGADGVPIARPGTRTEQLDTNLVLRAIGYRGTEVPGVPFDSARGTIANEGGRVIDPQARRPLTGVYTAGWIKRGPSGVIGTNKECSRETVQRLLEDYHAGRLRAPAHDRDALCRLLGARQPDVVDHDGWRTIDAHECERGARQGRPRVKFTSVQAMLSSVRSPR